MRAIFALLTAVFVLGIGARAATITVQNANDSGAGSLRQAIADAATGDTIEFSQAMTSTLTSPITIDKDIVIDGANVVTISGDNATSIFKITSGNVEIKNLTLKDGLASGVNGGSSDGDYHGGGGGGAGMGGAIYAEGGAITIDNVTFQGNKALGGNGGNQDGGVEYFSDGGWGGNSSFGSGGGYPGVYTNDRNNSPSSASDSTVVGAPGGWGGGGGGGANYSSFGGRGGTGGFGGGAGGSAYYGVVDVSQLTGRGTDAMIIRGGQFGGNGGMEKLLWTASYGHRYRGAGSGGGGAGLGGALFIKAASVTITNSNFTGNSVEGGAAGALDMFFNDAASVIRNYGDAYPDRGLPGESGQGVGGAIFVYETGNITGGGNTFSNNQSSFLNNWEDDIFTMNQERVVGMSDFGNDKFTVSKAFTEDTPVNLSVDDFSQNAIATNGNFIGIVIESLPANSHLREGSSNCNINNFFRIQDIENITFQPGANWPSGHNSQQTSWLFSAVYEKSDTDGNNYIYPVKGNTFEATVTAVNDAPTLGNVSFSVSEDSSMILSIGLFSNGYTDVDGDSLISITIVGLPENGDLKLDGQVVASTITVSKTDLESSLLTYVPDLNYPSPNASGVDSFVWTATNDNSESTSSKTLSITVNDTADPPVVANDSVSATGGVPIVIDILANDTDPLGSLSPPSSPSSYAITVIDSPNHGVMVVENQKIKYTPDNVGGTVSVTYKINNGVDSNTATVSISVSYNQYLGKGLVDKLGDENDGTTQPGDLTLREAMGLVGGDGITGIVFDNSMIDQTITLNSALGPIVIDKDFVIDGADKNITISGGGATSIFKITSGTVEIKNLTLKDGLASGVNGGSSDGDVTWRWRWRCWYGRSYLCGRRSYYDR